MGDDKNVAVKPTGRVCVVNCHKRSAPSLSRGQHCWPSADLPFFKVAGEELSFTITD